MIDPRGFVYGAGCGEHRGSMIAATYAPDRFVIEVVASAA